MSIPTVSLPKSRIQLTSLFASFPQDALTSSEQIANPLTHAPPSVKSLLLTLHVLFPNELLPALDLLDRKLVSKSILNDGFAGGIDPATHVSAPTEAREDVTTVSGSVYYVRSSQQPRSSRFAAGRTYDAFATSGQHYEVRLRAWNCSCPAYALVWVGYLGDGAFGGLNFHDGQEDIKKAEEAIEGMRGEVVEGMGREDRFGGLMRGDGGMPVCKHLLACLLAESWKGFKDYVEERVVEREEMSGWAAGWGG
ncbi:MAG: hypothetical protein LQ346_002020 [Caloplaca aetnensis]|nr:MAG: hypothetical protein LQ346_002020 [Caloplaca aetnensis]